MKSKVYLAGGFKGGWHELVKSCLENNFIFFDPQVHNLDDPKKYTAWDLYHIDKCDILLGFMSETNPSGFGLALEIGYARAKGKMIVLVDMRSPVDKEFQRYFSICHESSNIVLSSLEEAINFLKTF
jgi:nucleoside 2-deoxyribosyltransferase